MEIIRKDYVIYMIRNKQTNEKYIGSTRVDKTHTLETRFCIGYCGAMRANIYNTIPEEEYDRIMICNSQHRLGFKAKEVKEQKYYEFQILVRLSNVTKFEAHETEQEWINQLHPELNSKDASCGIDMGIFKYNNTEYYQLYRSVHREKIREYNKNYQREYRETHKDYYQKLSRKIYYEKKAKKACD